MTRLQERTIRWRMFAGLLCITATTLAWAHNHDLPEVPYSQSFAVINQLSGGQMIDVHIAVPPPVPCARIASRRLKAPDRYKRARTCRQ